MLQTFYPKDRADSVYGIDFADFWDRGYRGILFDIDNTLVPHGASATDEAITFFDDLHKIGFKTCLISNNKDGRVKPFADAVGTEYLCKANKPSRKGYLDSMSRIGTDISNTLFVGDQIFTDVWGANRTGLYSILTKPIDPKEEIQIILKRIPEKLILFFYNRKK